MHRPPARRARGLAGAGLTVALVSAGCADREGDDAVPVVRVEAQTCARPQRERGLGVVVDDDLVATAAHTVDGDLRSLTVDGRPASVVARDARTDLALLQTDLELSPVEWADDGDDPLGPAQLHRADGVRDVEVVRSGPLLVHDATDRASYRRLAHTFTPGVAAGTSGAPLTTDGGELLGIVVLDRSDTDEAHAVAAGELRALLDTASDVAGGRSAAEPTCLD